MGVGHRTACRFLTLQCYGLNHRAQKRRFETDLIWGIFKIFKKKKKSGQNFILECLFNYSHKMQYKPLILPQTLPLCQCQMGMPALLPHSFDSHLLSCLSVCPRMARKSAEWASLHLLNVYAMNQIINTNSIKKIPRCQGFIGSLVWHCFYGSGPKLYIMEAFGQVQIDYSCSSVLESFHWCSACAHFH